MSFCKVGPIQSKSFNDLPLLVAEEASNTILFGRMEFLLEDRMVREYE